MSVVTNIIFTFSIIEDGGDDTGEFALIKQINQWLNNERYGELKCVDECAGGYKKLEAPVYVAAFNHFDLDGFVKYVNSLHWHEPENVQVFVQEQEDDKFRIIKIGETYKMVEKSRAFLNIHPITLIDYDILEQQSIASLEGFYKKLQEDLKQNE